MMRFVPTSEEDVDDSGKHYLECSHFICQKCADGCVASHRLVSHDDIRCPMCRMMGIKICTLIGLRNLMAIAGSRCSWGYCFDSGTPLFHNGLRKRRVLFNHLRNGGTHVPYSPTQSEIERLVDASSDTVIEVFSDL